MNLADPSLITALDKGQALESLKSLPNQIDQAWKEASEIKFPSEYKSAKNIVIAGMGGSIYGGRIVKSLYDTAANSKVPICIANGYSLPGFVDKNTSDSTNGKSGSNVGCVSFSGNPKALIFSRDTSPQAPRIRLLASSCERSSPEDIL